MKKIKYIVLTAAALAILAAGCQKGAQHRAMILTGQNTIDWQASSTLLKQILEESGIFRVDIETSPAKGEDMTRFVPKFGRYDVVVLNYSGDLWSEKAREKFVDYVKNGGGVVVYHAASSAFPGWKEYEEICGLTGWGGRAEETGPYVYFTRGAGRMVVDSSAGPAGWFGKERDIDIRMRSLDHPVTKGLSVRWMHPDDLLYARLRGPARNMVVLATAFSDIPSGGTGRDEPVMMAITYGKGRTFHTTLGSPASKDNAAMKCAGFITTLQRGAEWAASGEVTQALPPDFPSIAAISVRPDLKIRSLEDDLKGLAGYELSKSTRFYTGLQEHIRRAAGDKEKLLDIEKELTRLLQDSETTAEAKKLILRELSWLGTEISVPVIKQLQTVPELREEVEFALERLGVN